MTGFRVSLDLVDTNNTIQLGILKLMAAEFNVKFKQIRPIVRKRIKAELPIIFTKTDTYTSLLNGPLSFHFGFHKGSEQARLDAIITTLANSLVVRVKPIKIVGRRFVGGFIIGAFRADFQDILGLKESIVATEILDVLPWLEWLLVRGNEIIISQYDISFGDHGRSGGAIMIRNNTKSWRVPTEYSGTPTNNWITRSVAEAITIIEKFVLDIVSQELSKVS